MIIGLRYSPLADTHSIAVTIVRFVPVPLLVPSIILTYKDFNSTKHRKHDACLIHIIDVLVNGGNGGESCLIRLWEREAYVLEGVRTSHNGEVRESKHAVEPGANNTGPCGRSHGRQFSRKTSARYIVPP
jgi:hypothetical protein